MRWSTFVVAIVMVVPVTELHPQDSPSDRESPQEPSLTWPVVGGALLGIGGWGAGGAVGLAVAHDCSGEWCMVDDFFIGAAVGGTLGCAVGTHLGNRRRGNLALDFLSGAAVWGASIGIAYVAASDLSDDVAVAVLIAEPIIQLATTVMVERATGRARNRREGPRLSLLPRRDGFAVGMSVSF